MADDLIAAVRAAIADPSTVVERQIVRPLPLGPDEWEPLLDWQARAAARAATTTERQRIAKWMRTMADRQLSLIGTWSGDDALRHAADLLEGETP